MSFVLLLVIVSGFSGTATAEPSRSINWLMQEPVSLFDLGMLRLRIRHQNVWFPELRATAEARSYRPKKFAGTAVYNWDENRISISAVFIGKPEKNACTAIVTKFRSIVLGPAQEDYAKQLFASHFGHINYSTLRPEDLDRNIVNITNLTVGLSDSEDDIFLPSKTVFCTARLSDGSVSYKFFD